MEGPSITAAFVRSFPQPKDLQEEDEDAPDAVITTETPPAVSAPRASKPDAHVIEQERPEQEDVGPEPITEGLQPLESTTSNQSNKNRSKSSKMPRRARTESAKSYVTAPEAPPKGVGPGIVIEEAVDDEDGAPQGYQNAVGGLTLEPRGSMVSQFGAPSLGIDEPLGATASTSSLIQRDSKPTDQSDGRPRSSMKDMLSKVARSSPRRSPEASEAAPVPAGDQAAADASGRKSRGGVRFDAPEDARQADLQVKARMTQMGLRRRTRSMRRSKAKHGQIIKMEKMLVRVDVTAEKLPEEYDENESQRTISRTVAKWREFMVVCREHVDEDAEFILQIYSTRVSFYSPSFSRTLFYES